MSMIPTAEPDRCPSCYSVGECFEVCPSPRRPDGYAIGRKKPTRTPKQRESYEAAKITVADACARPGCLEHHGIDPHHVYPEQHARAAGWDQEQIDHADNLKPLCRSCHEWVHNAANYDEAVSLKLLAAWKTKGAA